MVLSCHCEPTVEGDLPVAQQKRTGHLDRIKICTVRFVRYLILVPWLSSTQHQMFVSVEKWSWLSVLFPREPGHSESWNLTASRVNGKCRSTSSRCTHCKPEAWTNRHFWPSVLHSSRRSKRRWQTRHHYSIWMYVWSSLCLFHTEIYV